MFLLVKASPVRRQKTQGQGIGQVQDTSGKVTVLAEGITKHEKDGSPVNLVRTY